MSPNQPCPCGAGRKFKQCCRRLHRGAIAETPEALMRSRYAAYAVGEADYIVDTTHPLGPQHHPDRARWLVEVRSFCDGTTFAGLEVLEAEAPKDDEGWVTFRASLLQGGQDVSFTERSRFLKHEGAWRYHSGTPASAP